MTQNSNRKKNGTAEISYQKMMKILDIAHNNQKFCDPSKYSFAKFQTQKGRVPV